MKPVQSYTSYREYLTAVYESAKKSNPGLNMKRYATQLKIGGSNFKMILAAKRNLTIPQSLKVARALRMSPGETEYFEALVCFEQANGPWEKAYYRNKLKRAKKDLRVNSIHLADQSLLNDTALLPLLVYLSETANTDFDFNDIDCASLGRLFGLSAEKIKLLVAKLAERNALQRDENGVVHFVFDKLVNVRAQKEYLKRLMRDAEAKLESEYEREESFFTAITFSTSDENLQQLKEDLKKLMDHHMARGNAAAPGTRMAQACFQVFPVSGRTGPGLDRIDAPARTPIKERKSKPNLALKDL